MWFSHNVCELVSIFVTFLVRLAVSADETEDLARGWNSNIKWVKFKEAESLSKANNQPMMLLIHKSWCGACKALKPKFAASKEIEALSKDFVMVNTLDEEEPSDANYSPDGGYIPRILFVDQRGTVLVDIYNKNGNDRYKYYYHDPQDIASSMQQCLELTQNKTPNANEL